jgi:hypothetical protein
MDEEIPVFDPETQLWLIEQERERSIARGRHAHEIRRIRAPLGAAPRRTIGRFLVRAGLWLIPVPATDACSPA